MELIGVEILNLISIRIQQQYQKKEKKRNFTKSIIYILKFIG